MYYPSLFGGGFSEDFELCFGFRCSLTCGKLKLTETISIQISKAESIVNLDFLPVLYPTTPDASVFF